MHLFLADSLSHLGRLVFFLHFADGQNLDGQNLDRQNLDGQNLDGQNLDSQNLDSQTLYSRPIIVISKCNRRNCNLLILHQDTNNEFKFSLSKQSILIKLLDYLDWDI
jgi:hypothetical protein